MPNQPAPETVTVSFTLPKGLSDLISGLAKKGLTNRSDIIRRALLSYIPANEAAQIVASVVNDSGPNQEQTQTQGSVTYPTAKKTRK